jgi:hypothetical protein
MGNKTGQEQKHFRRASKDDTPLSAEAGAILGLRTLPQLNAPTIRFATVGKGAAERRVDLRLSSRLRKPLSGNREKLFGKLRIAGVNR